MATKVFDTYSLYYDLVYRDKDYAGEAAYVLRTLRRYCPVLETLLDLGTGSGRHAECLAHSGLRVDGVELSDTMHEKSVAMRARLVPDVAARLSFRKGDARSVRTGRTYDAVTALFHVASYQVSNDDLAAFFGTAAAHLETGGVFLFDVWYGPAVLKERPEQRMKEVRDGDQRVIRFTRPQHKPNENVVDVHFQVLAQSGLEGPWQELSETHSMRYLFLPELEYFLHRAGLKLVATEEFLTGGPLGEHTWNATLIARKA